MFDRELAPAFEVRNLTVRCGDRTILHEVNLDVPRGEVTGIIGPSGAGKSTLLRCLNRLVDLSPSLLVEGSVRYCGDDVRNHSVDPDDLRRRVGIVFQQPVTFPGSVSRNVIFAARKLGLVTKRGERELAERCLRDAGLWDEVKDRLHAPAPSLSVGQQQRLAIARALAGDPEVVLMDEPTSALDPRSTEAIEQTVASLRGNKTIVLVTHHLEQARRLASWIACICAVDGRGELMEAGFCKDVFCTPRREETREYLGVSAGCK